MTEIRRIRVSEVEHVADLWAEYAAELADPSEGLTDEARLRVIEHLRANASHPDAACLVAVVGDEVVGFATAATFTHPTLGGILGEIEEIYVHPDHRRRGVGTTIASAILDWLDVHGGNVMKVRIGRGLGQRTAIAFWEAMGFESDMVECSLYPHAQRVR